MSSEDVNHLAARIVLLEANMRSVGALLATLSDLVEDARVELEILHARVTAAVSE